VTILIATVALFGGIVAWLQADAGARGDNAIRDTQRYAAEALGKQAVGEAQVSYQYGTAARNWKEIDVLVDSASRAKDTAAQTRNKSVQDEVASLAEILGQPYFDPTSHTADNVPDVYAYQADKYLVDKTLLSERSTIEGNLNNAWESKSNNYTIHLTLLAAALALFGLSMALSGMVRPIFVGVALLLTLVTGGTVVGTFVERIASTPLNAVQAYAQGVGDAYKGDSTAAVDRFTQALRSDPTYADAMYERGNAYFNLGKYEDAARDYQAAMGAGRDDTSVAWNLGWTLYLMGKFDDAIKVDQQALEVDPTLAGPRLNLALAYLAAGKQAESQVEYDRAINDVVQLVADAKQAGRTVAPSLWFYIDAGARDLESLYDRLNDQPKYWEEAPAKETIADPFTAQAEAEKMFFKLKSLTVGLEYTGKPPAAEPNAGIDEFKFGTRSSDKEPLKLDTTFPADTKEVFISFDYTGMKDGQKIVYKVYVNGQEYPEFRVATDWDKGEKGHAEVTFSEDMSLSSTYSYYPGQYVVEMYVDSHLMQRGGFTIESAQP
jgi:tetratricopeptide (TPR) repeat protein